MNRPVVGGASRAWLYRCWERQEAGKLSGEKQTMEYPAGLKWTKQRKRVYEILKEATEPLSAAQIYARMEGWEQEQ